MDANLRPFAVPKKIRFTQVKPGGQKGLFMKYKVGLLLAAIVLCSAVATQAASDDPWPLAVRIHSYGAYQDAAWTHLQEIGVNYIFLSVPKAEEVDATMAKLKKHGLTAIVLRGDAPLSEASFVETLTPQLAICQKMGVKYMFLSAKRKDASHETVYIRLRAAGDVAKKYGVTIALETHPDLGTNGAVQAETMEAVNHPNIRVNFDSANITYYNKDTSAVAELKKSIDYVATMEFKDHNGEFETWVFPVLGKGVVNVKKLNKMLRKHGYAGPITLEFEGTKGVELSEAETKKAIADSVAYARSIGNFK
jgi:L-ribulose-5-phosphate 3-epimerase